VVFQFAYTDGHFSDIGYPKSYGGREEKRLYVLRDLTPYNDEDLSYQLMFPSGVSHTFGERDGELVSVSHNDGSIVEIDGRQLGINWFPNGFQLDWERLRGMPLSLLESNDPIVISPRYALDVLWKDGQIHDVRYTSRDGSKVINTTLERYEDGSMSMTKKSGVPGQALSVMDGFSYAVSSNGRQITHAGETVTCVDPCELGNITIKTTVDVSKDSVSKSRS
jgi:hypothetical protein